MIKLDVKSRQLFNKQLPAFYTRILRIRQAFNHFEIHLLLLSKFHFCNVNDGDNIEKTDNYTSGSDDRCGCLYFRGCW